jgi:hypothetical protein
MAAGGLIVDKLQQLGRIRFAPGASTGLRRSSALHLIL